MPMPYSYRHATAEFQAFLTVARDEMALDSDNTTYTAVQSVFLCFRRRLTVDQALAFADLLPAVLRAIFVADWRPCAPVLWKDRAELTAECKSLRPHHNLTPDNCITATAIALRSRIPATDLDPLLLKIGPEALAFWHVDAKSLRSPSFP